MYLRSIAVGAVAMGLAVVLGATPATAETFDHLTYLTFNRPVKVPGVTLTPGTYRFHLTNPTTSRNVMQVMSQDGGIVYSQFNTIPDFRPAPTPDATVTFKETEAAAPPAVHSFFYGGEQRGYEFVYPRQPVAAETAESAPAPAPPVVGEPPQRVAENASPAPAVTEPAPPVTPAPAPPEAAPSNVERNELPKTASPMPLVAYIGFASLLLGFAVHVSRRLT